MTNRTRRRCLLSTAILCLGTFALCPWAHGQTAEKQEPDPKNLEALRSLGYVDFPSETPAQRAKGRSGLTLHRAQHTASGYTLITSVPDARALLVNIRGKIINTWQDPDSEKWSRAELQGNGDLLVTGKLSPEHGSPEKRINILNFLARFDWQGRLLWRKRFLVHHDLDVDPAGTIYTLGLDDRWIDDSLRITDHTIEVFSAQGDHQSTTSLYDLLSSNPEIYRVPRTTDYPKAVKDDGQVDLLHANTIALMPFPSLAKRGDLYRTTNVMVTVRHQNLVAIIDLEAKRLLWAWGPGEVQFPHEATWLENGNVLLFDNGSEQRAFSRIVEVDPTTNEVVWTYKAKVPTRFFSAGRGTVQALANGNVLVASSNQGKIFEANRKGEVVWRYVHRGDDGDLLAMRAKRYPPAMVKPLLD